MQTFLGKSFELMWSRQSVRKKELWRFSPPLKRKNSPFEEGPHPHRLDNVVEGVIISSRTIETNREIETTTHSKLVVEESLHFHPVNTIQRPLVNKFPDLIPEGYLKSVHPCVKYLFTEKIPNMPLAGRLTHFSKVWELLTQDQNILAMVKGYFKGRNFREFAKVYSREKNFFSFFLIRTFRGKCLEIFRIIFFIVSCKDV